MSAGSSDLSGAYLAEPPASSFAVQRPLRIAVLVHTSSVSGPGRQLAGLITSLASPAIEFRVLVLQRRNRPLTPFVEHLNWAGIRHTVVMESGRLDHRLVGRVADALREFQPDVVETHGYKPTLVIRALRLRRPNWAWIAFWHGATTEDWKVRLYHRLDRALMRGADHIVVMSEEQRRIFAKAGPPVSVIANAVLAPAAEETAPLDLDRADRPVLGVVGRLSSEKGVDVFLRAAESLNRRSFPYTALIVGDGPERHALEAMSRELGLSSRVRFLGMRNDVGSVYRAIDLLVIPSRSEGLPNVLLEAMAQDRAVVATTVGAIPTVVDSPLVGLLVPRENPEALAEAIVNAVPLVSDPRARTARSAAAGRFSLEHRAERLRELYISSTGARR